MSRPGAAHINGTFIRSHRLPERCTGPPDEEGGQTEMLAARQKAGRGIFKLTKPETFDFTRPHEMKISAIVALGVLSLAHASPSFAENINGKKLFTQRCAVCHGVDIKGTGPLARKSNPATPDLTTSAFKKRLNDYPGVIVSSVILRPNGDLIPRTLKENGVKLPPHPWTVKDLRDVNQYMSDVILRKR